MSISTPPDQSPEETQVTEAGPVVVIPARLQERAQAIQRQLPRLDWEWCVVLARLEGLPRSAKRSLMAQAQAEHRSERQYAESNGGWRHGVNQAADRAGSLR